MKKNKLRVIKDFEKLSNEIREQIKLVYPNGFYLHLIEFTDQNGDVISALPFETDDRYYLVRMTKNKAKQLILQDDDYDNEGKLKQDIMKEYTDKHTSAEYSQKNLTD